MTNEQKKISYQNHKLAALLNVQKVLLKVDANTEVT